MKRDLDLVLKILKLMKDGERAIADCPVRVALIVLGVAIVSKMIDRSFDTLNAWLIRREQAQVQAQREHNIVHLSEGRLADSQLQREPSAAVRN